MLWDLFRPTDVAFEIRKPRMVLTNAMSDNLAQLQKNGIVYEEVTKEYLCFRARVFSEEELCVGLHHRGGRLSFIELFRPKEYYAQDYDIDASFADLNRYLIERYGKPFVRHIVPTTDANAGSQAKWFLRGMRIEHWIFDRFGPEEHLHIYLKEGRRRAI